MRKVENDVIDNNGLKVRSIGIVEIFEKRVNLHQSSYHVNTQQRDNCFKIPNIEYKNYLVNVCF